MPLIFRFVLSLSTFRLSRLAPHQKDRRSLHKKISMDDAVNIDLTSDFAEPIIRGQRRSSCKIYSIQQFCFLYSAC